MYRSVFLQPESEINLYVPSSGYELEIPHDIYQRFIKYNVYNYIFDCNNSD